jgi:hypothetical protein
MPTRFLSDAISSRMGIVRDDKSQSAKCFGTFRERGVPIVESVINSAYSVKDIKDSKK